VLPRGEGRFGEPDEDPDVDVDDELRGNGEVGEGEDGPAEEAAGESVEAARDYGGDGDEEEEGSAGSPEEEADFPVEEGPGALEPAEPGLGLVLERGWEGGECVHVDVE